MDIAKKGFEQNRDEFMDFLKGIAILAVVIGHSVTGNEKTSLLFHIIYSFHMPLLIFVSAYVEEQRSEKYMANPWTMLPKRGWSLLVPYCVWCVIAHIQFVGTWTLQLEGFADYFVGITSGGLWFLPVLFGLKCMHAGFWAFAKYVWKKDGLLTDIISLCILEGVVIALALLLNIPYLRNMITFAVPYFVGVFLARHDFIKKLVGNQIIITLCIIAYVVAFPYFDFVNTTSYTQILRIFLSVCVIVVLMNCQGVKEWKWSATICKWGKYSMGIYLLHTYMIDFVVAIQSWDSGFMQGVTATLLSIVICWVSILIYKLLTRSRLLGRILFGK